MDTRFIFTQIHTDPYSCWTSLPCNSSNLETLVCVPDRGSSCNSRKASSAGQPQPSCNWPVSELLKRATRWTRVLVVSLPTPQPSSTTIGSRFLFPVPVTNYRTSVIIAPQPPRGRQSDDELEMAPWPHHTRRFWQGKTTPTHTHRGGCSRNVYYNPLSVEVCGWGRFVPGAGHQRRVSFRRGFPSGSLCGKSNHFIAMARGFCELEVRPFGPCIDIVWSLFYLPTRWGWDWAVPRGRFAS